MSFAQRESRNRADAPKAVPQAVRRGLDSPSHALDAPTRRALEPRFAHDFSRVRIHTGPKAAASAHAVHAHAYSVGNDVVFASGRYNPATPAGQHLLAHELTHVAQQTASPSAPLAPSTPAQEAEADRLATRALASHPARTQQTGPPALARFSDTNHHIVEEVAFESFKLTPQQKIALQIAKERHDTAEQERILSSVLSPQQIAAIERGNVERDYSQLPRVANIALLGTNSTFGGYSPDEHIDNFIFDVEHDRWRGRGVGPQKYRFLDPKHEEFGPIEHISAQLRELARGGMGPANMEHLGNAFHTVEDFFAHSNFIELLHNDDRFGKDLLTASVTTESGNEWSTINELQGSVAPANMQAHFAAQGAAADKTTEATSHANMNKDTAASRNFVPARHLAALVIQELTGDVLRVMTEKEKAKRMQLMQEVVVAKIRHYLRPPNPTDPWWQGLASHSAGTDMTARIEEAEKRTPITVNQKPYSPLRNLEASKDASMAIPFGAAASLGRYGFLQAGVGVTRPDAFDSRFTPPPARDDRKSSPVAGVQWTGHF